MKKFVVAAIAVCAIAPAHADPARYHRYWKEAKDYASKGFAEADKAVAVMKTDHETYCYQLAMTRTELERSTKLFMYAFEQIDADTSLTEAELDKLRPMIDEYKGIKGVSDRYVALQESRCLSGPSYSDTLPSNSYSSSSSSSSNSDYQLSVPESDDDDEGEDEDSFEDDDDYEPIPDYFSTYSDDYDASEDDNF